MNQKLNHSPIHGHAYGQNDYTGVMITNNMGFSQNRSLAELRMQIYGQVRRLTTMWRRPSLLFRCQYSKSLLFTSLQNCLAESEVCCRVQIPVTTTRAPPPPPTQVPSIPCNQPNFFCVPPQACNNGLILGQTNRLQAVSVA